MYCTPTETLTARVQHLCTNCAQPINKGDEYKRWASMEDCVFTNKMHPECLESLIEMEGSYFEYSPFDGERPAKVQP